MIDHLTFAEQRSTAYVARQQHLSSPARRQADLATRAIIYTFPTGAI
jgi:hypothetical protein